MVALNIEVGGVQVMSRELARMKGAVGDLRPILTALAQDLATTTAENFRTEGASGAYGRWAPLSPGYAWRKQLAFPGRPILVRTGALRDSLTKVPLDIQKTTATSVILGTGVGYAGYHQAGTPRMPRRPPISITENMRRQMVKTIQRYIVSGVVTRST